MRSKACSIVLGLLLLALPALAHESPSANELKKKLKGGWQESSQMDLTLTATKLRLKSRFEREGYQLKHEIEMGKHNESCLMLWEKNGRQVIVMVWRIDVNRTGYSIGEVKNDRN